MWVTISSFVLNVIFIAFIKDTFYRNAIIPINETDHRNFERKAIYQAPAKRVVLFIANGVSADVFFGLEPDNVNTQHPAFDTNSIYFLRSMITNNAPWGITNTVLSSESNPDSGLIAMFAGFPFIAESSLGIVDKKCGFDSVINRTQNVLLWGGKDLIHLVPCDKGAGVYLDSNLVSSSLIVEKRAYFLEYPMVVSYPIVVPNKTIKSANLSEDFDLDIRSSVFNFFENYKTTRPNYFQNDKILFAMQFLSCQIEDRKQTSPSLKLRNMRRLLDNLDLVVGDIHQKIEEFFKNDNKTTYIFIGNRGQRRSDPDNVGIFIDRRTPFIIWGAGINQKARESLIPTLTNYQARLDLEQINMATLIATLLGEPVPKHSLGILPGEFLNYTSRNLAYAYLANTKQIIAHYYAKHDEMVKNIYFKSYCPFRNGSSILIEIERIDAMFQQNRFVEVIDQMKHFMRLLINGLKYMNDYYKPCLTLAFIISLIFWCLHLISALIQDNVILRHTEIGPSTCFASDYQWNIFILFVFIIVYITMCITSYYLYVSRLPFQFYIYFGLPQFLLCFLTTTVMTWKKAFQVYNSMIFFDKIVLSTAITIYGFLLNAMVWTYLKSYLYMMWLLITSLWIIISQTDPYPKCLAFKWICSTLLIALFPIIDLLHVQLDLGVIIPLSGLLWIIVSVCLIINETKCKATEEDKICFLVYFQPAYLSIAVIIMVMVRTQIVSTKFYPLIHIVSGLMCAISIVTPFFSSTIMRKRLQSILLGMVVPALLLSTEYDSLFLFGLYLHIMNWVEIETDILSNANNQRRGNVPDIHNKFPSVLSIMSFDIYKIIRNGDNKYIRGEDFRLVLFATFYILLSLFGTGKLTRDTLNNPEFFRAFASEYQSPLIMLYFVKILMPIVMICAGLQTILHVAHTSISKPLYIFVLFWSVMSIYFISIIINVYRLLYQTSACNHANAVGDFIHVGQEYFNNYLNVPLFDFIVFELLLLFIIFAYLFTILLTNVSAFKISMFLSNYFATLFYKVF